MWRQLLLVFVIITGAGCATLKVAGDDAQKSQWRLVYANDEQGEPVDGSKAALIDAVRDGKPVRVYTRGRRVEHAADAQFLTIFEGEVFAQLTPIEAQQPETDPARVLFRNPGQKWRSIVGTNGFVTAFMDGRDPNERNGATRWFVED